MPSGAVEPVTTRSIIADRIERSALFARRIGIERVILGFHGRADARIRPAAETLHDNAPDATTARGSKQMIRPDGPQPVAGGKDAVEPAQVRRPFQIGQLVDDNVHVFLAHRSVDGRLIACIGNNRPGAKTPYKTRFLRRTRQPDDRVSAIDEARNQPLSDRPGGTGNENAHGPCSRLI
jgi:hypothetical protein